MAVSERPIFVIELLGASPLAFEATDEAQAADLAGTHWFTQALCNYLRSKKSCPRGSELGLHVRAATREETLVYRNIAHEFAEMAGSFLFAPIQ